jgi:hypothetical protein
MMKGRLCAIRKHMTARLQQCATPQSPATKLRTRYAQKNIRRLAVSTCNIRCFGDRGSILGGKLQAKLPLCLTKYHATKTNWGVHVQLHAFLSLALDRGEWSASHSGRFTPRRKIVTIAYEAEKAPKSVWTMWIDATMTKMWSNF